MKKNFLVIACTLLVFTIGGCGGAKESSKVSNSENTEVKESTTNSKKIIEKKDNSTDKKEKESESKSGEEIKKVESPITETSKNESKTENKKTENTSVNSGTESSNNSAEGSHDTTEVNETPEPPAHQHSFSEATCTNPATCSCGATNGSALGHDFGDNNKFCSRCGCTNPNYKEPVDPNMPSPDDWQNTYWENNYTYATYSSSDLVSMGFIPEGTCDGTIVKLYKVPEKNSSGMYSYVASVYFSGNPVPIDWSYSGSVESNLNNHIMGRLKSGESGKYRYQTSGLSVG